MNQNAFMYIPYVSQLHHCLFEIEKDRLLVQNHVLQKDLDDKTQQLHACRLRLHVEAERVRKRHRARNERRAVRRRIEVLPPVVESAATRAHLAAIFSKLHTLDDILALRPFSTNPALLANTKFRRLCRTLDAVEGLQRMVGLKKIKDRLFQLLSYYTQFGADGESMPHVVIDGPPGVGKSALGAHLAKFLLALGVLPTDKFVEVKRSDLVAGYLGQTAIKTQAAIDEAMGGVLFIDEAYSLGDESQRDSFSKECLNVITQNLTAKQNRGKWVLMIAGYAEELESCFFAANRGLQRRFPFVARLSIDAYDAVELCEIFVRMMVASGWRLLDAQPPPPPPPRPLLPAVPSLTALPALPASSQPPPPPPVAPKAHRALLQLVQAHKSDFRMHASDMEELLKQAKFVAANRMMRTNLDFGPLHVLLMRDIEEAFEAGIAKREAGSRDPYPSFYT